MIAVIQRVLEASVKVDNVIIGEIGGGYLILLGVGVEDNSEDLEWLAKKIVGLRVFSDSEGKMNLDINQVDGNILLISQFTLLASTIKGNRPSFLESAKPDLANDFYEKMILRLSGLISKKIETGKFGADMKVSLINDGPVTIIIDSKKKK